MYSIYHFFGKLILERHTVREPIPLESLPVLQDNQFFSCANVGQFPDRAIRVNAERSIYTGGELIELKDAKGYSVSSFNSTIPSGKKSIEKILTPHIQAQMIAAGDDVFAVPVREVFYLVRGRSPNLAQTKICLVHGSFFETVPVEQLISQAFGQILEERLGAQLDEATKQSILAAFTEQSSFSRVRNVPKASVKPRFRVMTEVKKEGNPLNSKLYPEIQPDTLNLILPIHQSEDEQHETDLLITALGEQMSLLTTKRIKHPLNGWFIVFQCQLV